MLLRLINYNKNRKLKVKLERQIILKEAISL
jgi:hypothetical protein